MAPQRRGRSGRQPAKGREAEPELPEPSDFVLNLGKRIWPITPGTVPEEVTAEQLSGEEALIRANIGEGSATAYDLHQPTARRPPPPEPTGRQGPGQGQRPLLYVAEGSQFSTYVFNPLAEDVPAPEADVIPLLEALKNDEADKEPEL